MDEYQKSLNWIDRQKKTMVDQIQSLANINTNTLNFPGLQKVTQQLADAFSVFEEPIQLVELPPFEWVNIHGQADKTPLAPMLYISKRSDAPKQALFVIHMDTVYTPEDPFKESFIVDKNTLRGPGVADAKGGIVVMLKALEAFEQSPLAQKIGWQVIINSDEEIGSPGSGKIIMDIAKKCDVGFVFEPCLPDGSLIGARKGSGNFTLVARGRSAHAGRDPEYGRNAITALAECVVALDKLNGERSGLILNVGVMNGGNAVNVVPAMSVARVNVRVHDKDDQEFVQAALRDIISEVAKKREGIEFDVYGGFTAPPKLLNGPTLELFRYVQSCGIDLDLHFGFKDSGGVCDGNRLSSVGLPNVDTMGVQGGCIHSDEEYLLIDSLPQRTKLMTLCLLKWAQGEWDINR